MTSLIPLKSVLVVFAKRPKPGHGKQRLAAEIGDKKAFAVSKILLEATLDLCAEWDETLVISPSEMNESSWATQLLEKPVIAIPQNDGSLGVRLEQIDKEVRMLSFSELIFIGTDAPLLTIEQLNSVKQNLKRYDQVFMPAADGGVIIMASRVPWTGLESVDWSTGKVFSQLKSLAIEQGLSVQIMSEQIDLDDLESFNKIKSLIINSSDANHKVLLDKLENR